MSMQAIKDVKLNVRPIYIDMSHLYVYEGPCRFGKGEELTYEFDRAMNEENNKRFLQDIRDHAPEWMNVLEPVYVYRNDDWRIPEEMIQTMAKGYDETDFYIFADGARCGDVILEFIRRYPKACACLSDCRGNTIINAALLSHGCEIYPITEGWPELTRILTAVRVRKMLREMRVLSTYRFNASQSMPSAPDSFNDLNRVTDLFGVRFRYLNLHELMDMLHVGPNDQNPSTPGRARLNLTEEDMAEIGRMADAFIAGAKDNVLPREEVINTFKMVQVIRKNMEDEDCNAFVAPCPDACSTRRLNEERCTMCLSHSLNNEMGLPSACEYDITALICLAILMGVSGKAPYMSNTIRCKTDEEGMFPACPFLTKEDLASVAGRDDLLLTYHSVPNRKLHGFDSEASEYGIQPFAYSGWAATLRYDFTQDKGQYVTQCRIDPNCKKMMITRGVVETGFGYDKANCTLGLIFSVKDPDALVRTQQGFGLHMPLVLGDYVEELKTVADIFGLEPVVCL